MVTIRGEAIEFRNCLLEYSSAGSGLAIQAKKSKIHDNTFRDNGQFGFSVGGSDNLIENNLVQGNDLAGYKEWGTGGTKIVGNGNIIRRNRFLGNLGGVAIWLDCGPCNNVIEYNHVSGNYGEGIRAETSFHSYIGYNVVENTRPCTSTMFGKTQTHCTAISVQNSAETTVRNNFLKDNLGVGILLISYGRKAADLPKWQQNYADEKHKQWLRRSWDSEVIYANDNLVCNNVIIQTTPQAQDACVALRGPLNGQSPQCYGNLFDYNFYWNAVTHAPKVQVRNLLEVPDGKSQWQTRYGMDTHSLGGFSPEDYRQSPFDAEYPYKPTSGFAGIGKGEDLKGMPWHVESDYLGNPLGAGHRPGIGHVEYLAK
jgi:parallel beta-helix repeat protein